MEPLIEAIREVLSIAENSAKVDFNSFEPIHPWLDVPSSNSEDNVSDETKE